MLLTVTPLYAAVMVVFFVAMSFYVIINRARADTLIGDGGNVDLLVAIRRHGNLSEYMPLALLMMAIAEVLGLGATWLHIAGLALLAGRLIHPFGVNRNGTLLAARVAGVLATVASMLIPAVYIFVVSFS